MRRKDRLRIWVTLSLFFLTASFGGCKPALMTGYNNSVSPIQFGGIQSIDQISGDGLRVNWNLVSGASVYQIFFLSNSSVKLVKAILADTSTGSYVITGLTPNTTYTLWVHLLDENGYTDNNQNLLTAQTLSASVTHEGWTQAQALGGRSPVSQAAGLVSTHASVTLGWNPMVSLNATVTSYNVYRATSSQWTKLFRTACCGSYVS